MNLNINVWIAWHETTACHAILHCKRIIEVPYLFDYRRPRISSALESRNINKHRPRISAAPTSGNMVAHRANTRNVSEDFQKQFLCSGHKICVRHKRCARGKTSRHLGNMIASAMLPPQGVLVLPAPKALAKLYTQLKQLEPSYKIKTCDGGWPNGTAKSSQFSRKPFNFLNTTA